MRRSASAASWISLTARLSYTAFGSSPCADDAAAQDEDVHVVVLDALMRRICIVAQPRTDPLDPVRCHRRADAAAADDDAALGPMFPQRRADCLGVVGIIDRAVIVGTNVE